jgi:serine/threonine-protein kinase
VTDHPLFEALADRYRIDRELGRGGFAVVYLAHDLRHDRPVGLKVLHPDIAAALGVERFQREIHLAARLQHPHILGVFDSGEAAGQLWYVMPYVEGESLRDRIVRERQLPVADAVRIVQEVADALDYAHRHGVIHRDIKPENILLTDRHALVADFGIARAVGADALTLTGMAIGTPAYMSPEQASGEGNVDARSDLYALGCVLYEMLAGEPPFTGPTVQAILSRALTEPPRPVHPIRDAVPAALDTVMAKALARVPADRYASGSELAAAIAAAAGQAPRSARPLRRLAPPRLASVFVLGLVIGLGALVALTRVGGGGGVRRLAVLPFENAGADSTAYFADGITDEIRGKLTAVPGMQVTARTSAEQYKGTTKRPAEIGHELGVEYLLTGTVRWATGAGGTRRVRVTPELVQVSTGSTRWQQAFDTTLSDVFQVQADIAARVARELDVALGSSAQQRLSERPTGNLAAYDAFLRGEELSDAMGTVDIAPLRRALAFYEQAVGLDSGFALAWARVSQTQSELNRSGRTVAGSEQAREAAEQALKLGGARPEGHVAMGTYLLFIAKDYDGALQQFTRGLATTPNDAALLTGAGRVERTLGRWDDALAHLRQAQRLDPRSVAAARTLAYILHDTRQYQEALIEEERALALAPKNLSLIQGHATTYCSLGDLAGARRVIAEALARGVDTTALIVRFSLYQEMMWVLDDSLRHRVLTLRPEDFNGDRGHWGLKVGGTWRLLGDSMRAHMYGDSAVLAFAEQLRAFPEDAQLHELLGRALALAGRRIEAVREAELSLRLRETKLDAATGPYVRYQVARIYIQAGEYEPAIDGLGQLLHVMASDLTPGWLRIDPIFAPLRGNPRFEQLLRSTS